MIKFVWDNDARDSAPYCDWYAHCTLESVNPVLGGRCCIQSAVSAHLGSLQGSGPLLYQVPGL